MSNQLYGTFINELAQLVRRRRLRESRRELQDLRKGLGLGLMREIQRASYEAWASRVTSHFPTELDLREAQELETQVALGEIFKQLAPEQRPAFRLWAKGATPSEIAKELGISRSTAYRIVGKIQKLMLEQVERVQTTDTDALLDVAIESQDFETAFNEGLAEVEEIRARMQEVQTEIDRERETAQRVIASLGFL